MSLKKFLFTAAAIAVAAGTWVSVAHGSGPSGATSEAGKQAVTAQEIQPAHSLVVVPAAVSMSTEFAKGCWVRLYDGVDFRGQELLLVGPLRLTGMDNASPWWRHWNSAVVGPRARVTLFSGVNYEGRVAELAAGQRAADLARQPLSWSAKIESAHVDCSGE